MKPVLILENQLPENSAYLGSWLRKHNIEYTVYNADVHGNFPSSIEEYSALAVMGGAMSANDPLLNNRQAEILILQCMYRDIPVIGHCLGGQLIAKALGGKITKSPQPEIGWQPIKYVNDPDVNVWFGQYPTDTVIHWHYDTFSLPTGSKLLASSDACPNQAFTIGKALAMQFHIEMDINKCETWVKDKDELWNQALKDYDTVQNAETILGGISPYLLQHQKTADNIYSHWLSTTEWCEHTTN